MKFTPGYNVIYKGTFYEAGETFEIDEADAEEMRQHGEVEEGSAPPHAPEKDPEKDPENPGNQEEEPGEKPTRRGRPRREV